jgi:hypothetical protein
MAQPAQKLAQVAVVEFERRNDNARQGKQFTHRSKRGYAMRSSKYVWLGWLVTMALLAGCVVPPLAERPSSSTTTVGSGATSSPVAAAIGWDGLDDETKERIACHSYSHIKAPPGDKPLFWRLIFNFNSELVPCFELRSRQNLSKVWRQPLDPCDVMAKDAASGNKGTKVAPSPASMTYITVTAPAVMPEVPAAPTITRTLNQITLMPGHYLKCTLNIREILETHFAPALELGAIERFEPIEFYRYFSMSALVTLPEQAVRGTLASTQPDEDACLAAKDEDAEDEQCEGTTWRVSTTSGVTHTIAFSATYNGQLVDPAGRSISYAPGLIQAWWAGLDHAHFMVSNVPATTKSSGLQLSDYELDNVYRFGFVVDQAVIDDVDDIAGNQSDERDWSRHRTTRINFRTPLPEVSFFTGATDIFIGGSPDDDTFTGNFHQIIFDPQSGGSSNS